MIQTVYSDVHETADAPFSSTAKKLHYKGSNPQGQIIVSVGCTSAELTACTGALYGAHSADGPWVALGAFTVADFAADPWDADTQVLMVRSQIAGGTPGVDVDHIMLPEYVRFRVTAFTHTEGGFVDVKCTVER